MSVFSIKLKTRNGNDVKKKETITVFFRIKYKKGFKTKAEYTYRIMSSKGVHDPQKVMELKNSGTIKSYEDMMLKVIINLCYLVDKIAKEQAVDPDFVLFMTPDLQVPKNRSFMYLKDIFFRPESNTPGKALTREQTEVALDVIYKENWDEAQAKKLGIKIQELDILHDYSVKHCLTKFMFIDPGRDPVKYAKSIHICNMLQDRIDRNLQITENPIKT
jgi:hypothetical protein